MTIRSIGAKLTLWYTSLLTLTFLLLGGVAYGLLAYSLARDMDAALTGVADVLAQKARVGSHDQRPSEIDELFRRFFGFSPLDRRADIYDPRGRRDPGQKGSDLPEIPLSPLAQKNAAQGLPTFETIPSTGRYPVRVLIQPVIKAGTVTNLVRVGMSLENMLKTRRRFLLIMAALLPLGLLLAGGGGWLLAHRALRPVDRMTRTARQISARQLDQRLQESGNDDELDRLAKTLNSMLDRLNATIDQMRQFSADASHELQTPLTILKGEMEVALRSPRSPAEYQHVLQSGLEEIDRINRLVEGLLMLARADAGVLRMDFQPVTLNDLLQEICEQMKTIADDRAIDLQLDMPTPVDVDGDREHLRRLLLNLIDNAIKYTPSGGSVKITLQPEKSGATVAVSDTGIGLSPAEQKQIFNRFHRSTETRARNVKGVGLGLNIVHSIVAAHGGHIHVESAPGQGSTFAVCLPTRAA